MNQEKSQRRIYIKENIQIIFSVIFIIFILWMLFGGLLEKDKNVNTVYIDCKSNPNSMYCNGDYKDQIRNENGAENNFYQNLVR